MKTIDISRDLTVTFDNHDAGGDAQWSVSSEPGIDTIKEIRRVLKLQRFRVSDLNEALRHARYHEVDDGEPPDNEEIE